MTATCILRSYDALCKRGVPRLFGGEIRALFSSSYFFFSPSCLLILLGKCTDLTNLEAADLTVAWIWLISVCTSQFVCLVLHIICQDCLQCYRYLRISFFVLVFGTSASSLWERAALLFLRAQLHIVGTR